MLEGVCDEWVSETPTSTLMYVQLPEDGSILTSHMDSRAVFQMARQASPLIDEDDLTCFCLAGCIDFSAGLSLPLVGRRIRAALKMHRGVYHHDLADTSLSHPYKKYIN